MFDKPLKAIFCALLVFAHEASALTCADLDGSFVFANDGSGTYLGFFGSEYSADSIMNEYGGYGSPYGTNSVRNEYSNYGSPYSNYSASNEYALYPPIIYKFSEALAYLTVNTSFSARVSLAEIDAYCTFYATAPIGPLSPSVVNAADGEDTEILDVVWSSVSGAISYNVYISLTTNIADFSYVGNSSGTAASITGLEQGVTYYVAVSTVSAVGESLLDAYDSGYLLTSTHTSTYTVTPSAGAGGSISPSSPQTVEEGANTSFTVTPNSGYQIDAVGGTCGGTLLGSTYTTAAVTQDCTVTASFAELPATTYTVTPSAGAGGSISPSSPQTVEEGANTSFTVTPNSGYQIDAVGGTCGGTLLGSTYTTAAVTQDCSVKVDFTEELTGLPIWVYFIVSQE